ncbi:tripartite tricarboxylate transporter TctB family protein [Devosia sp. YIM 151766]|uniref:tripartite tricarboxylate transporter TctB family protein n=1 Tax=Devosia sp. YIM 151766 TaxID=3017325 RepID=UPI00255CB32C|nr:tripartite tricarboxylate transporter TctB family protein [Devosia sp. YIM 151766]WIY52384.1 tripartite tricarboxylate transporter TctB family protein [Devosia sp. YIM 151766]
MPKFISREFCSGIVLSSVGATYTIYALTRYPLGSLNEMGPGMFPVMAGAVLGIFGLAVLASSLIVPGTRISIDWGPFSYIIGGLVAFAILLPLFGFIPAIAVMTIVVTFWNSTASVRAKVILVVLLPALAYVIFYWGLNVRMAPFRIPL